MLSNLLLVGLGGATGSMLRYLCQRAWNSQFPYGTLIVNLAGCFLIGLLWGSLKEGETQKRLLLATGFCGGFTTFSAFTQESMQLLMENRWLVFSLYVGLSVTAGLLATYLGYKLIH